MDRIGAPEIAIGDACKGIPHDKREQRGQAVSGDAEGQVPTPALDEQRVSREAIRPPGSGVDELEYWRANAMHYHGLCVALEDEIDCWNLALDGKNAYIRRHTEWLEKANGELRDLHTTLSAFTNCASDGRNWRMMWQRLCEQREETRERLELAEGAVNEWRECESIRNGDLVTALEACMEALSQADDSGVVIPLLEDAMKRAEHARSGTCYKCGGCRMKPLPKFADACNCEGGGGGGFENPSPAEEKYNDGTQRRGE